MFTAASLAAARRRTPRRSSPRGRCRGVGAALAAPAALALIMTLFAPGPERNRALGLFGAVAGAGGAAGAILGGLLTDWFGWEAVLYVNVPIGLAAIALAPVLLPEARDERVRGFDLTGAAAVTGGLALLVYTLVDGNEAGWTSARTLGLGAGAVAALAAFAAVEARVRHPLVQLGIFRNRSLTGGNVAAVLMTMAIFPMFYVMTLYLQQVKGYEPVKAGVAQLPVAIAIGVGSAIGSRLITRFGPRVPVGAALAVAACGLAWFSRMSVTGHYAAEVLAPAVVMGLGTGVVFVGTAIAATAGASADESGLASGLINTAQQVGGALGLALVVAVSAHVTEGALADGERVLGIALNEGFRAGMLTAAGVALVAAAGALALIPGRTPTRPRPRMRKVCPRRR
ncbi:MFS transporter [Actinomadura sp. CNU-125]|uniref:MFS transporter n=1 Tax=Actinomadura sp. CNU-125 TaxID=1904961 RepID=UPI0021CCFAA9|nr:MFS transporter [Actinomadura sp. CNU-125]